MGSRDHSAGRARDGRLFRPAAAGLLTTAAAIEIGRRLWSGRARTLAMAWSYRLAETTVHYRHQVYSAMYLLGLTPWDRQEPNPQLVAELEAPSAPPVGRALELGCGTGTNSTYLAQRGWDVTAVDIVPKALAIARRKSQKAGVSPLFVKGDVTHLDLLGVGDGYTLLVDVGCFHAIPPARRDAYAHSVSAVAAPGSMLLLLGQFARPARQASEAGVTPDEVRQRFGAWELLNAERLPGDGARDKAAEWFEIWHYRLRRRS